ncbi:MAG: hypothetical protein GC149_10915 [Gammaproteobacteria bacterium]|nr:hypothetical protein [Gammaproteobacteria bacterium]
MFKQVQTNLRVKKYGYMLVCMTTFWHMPALGEVLVDPTQPPGVQISGKGTGIKSAPEWVLSSTLIAPARRLATINGKTVAVGEQIGGARVVSIEPARVSLKKGNRQFDVELLPREFKRIR